MNNKEKNKLLARYEYIYLQKSQKDIAADLECSERTILTWKNEDGDWDDVRDKAEKLPRVQNDLVYETFVRMLDDVKDKVEWDALSKAAAFIDRLTKGKSNFTLKQSVCIEFLTFLFKKNLPEKAKEYLELMTDFLRESKTTA
ncbi:hypothetical protein [Bernardetia sp.]|uniref:hypothetical protein n=1 Tax=Bernardetia sp. TaxID=1937974 RepID=UPI0025B833F1|nr:hypothetical protein [Bernardetia sp.]